MAVLLASTGGIPADDNPSRGLALLPEHILREVAYHSDEKTIWRMMAVCRGVREAIESVLRPYLAEKEVICTPRLVPDSKWNVVAGARRAMLPRGMPLERFLMLMT